jgi:hypothetical protein
MAVASSVFVKKVHLAAAEFCTLFRVNTGTGWVGKMVRVSAPKKVQMFPGDVLVREARPLKAGLVNGGGDLVGWRSVIITPEMVGQKIAQFVSLECKYGSGRLEPEQKIFARQVNEAGGIGAEIRDVADPERILK